MQSFHNPVTTLPDAIATALALMQTYNITPDDIRQYIRHHVKSERIARAQAHADTLPDLRRFAQHVLETSVGRSIYELTKTNEIFVLMLCYELDQIAPTDAPPPDTLALFPKYSPDHAVKTHHRPKRWWEFWK
jgi:hypothetical protein